MFKSIALEPSFFIFVLITSTKCWTNFSRLSDNCFICYSFLKLWKSRLQFIQPCRCYRKSLVPVNHKMTHFNISKIMPKLCRQKPWIKNLPASPSLDTPSRLPPPPTAFIHLEPKFLHSSHFPPPPTSHFPPHPTSPLILPSLLPPPTSHFPPPPPQRHPTHFLCSPFMTKSQKVNKRRFFGIFPTIFTSSLNFESGTIRGIKTSDALQFVKCTISWGRRRGRN